MKTIKISLMILALACIISSCSKPMSPTYLGYQNFRMEKIGFSGNVLATDVKLYNPNSYPLVVKSASMDVYLNDKFFGHTAFDSLVTLPA
ncbi:MAG: hypothetical protein M3Y85_06815, partial [Bacteroidota bacterium]|nr:hypothetical protein [Bacteroidota bacterium]